MKKLACLLLLLGNSWVFLAAQDTIISDLARFESDLIQLNKLLPDLPGSQHTGNWSYTIQSFKSMLYSLPEIPDTYQQAMKGDGKPVVSLDEFEKALDSFAVIMKEQQRAYYWVNNQGLPESMYDLTKEMKSGFYPFAESLIVHEGARVALWGDLHGSAQSLAADLNMLIGLGFLNNDFSIADPNFYMLFLGDYTDRGKYGAEVIYMLLRLKIANPNKVFMARGNHEDADMIAGWGFLAEIMQKYGKSDHTEDLLTRLYNFYNLLPVVIYLGSGSTSLMNFVQCNHGGLELGFDPSKFLSEYQRYRYILISSYDRLTNIAKLKSKALEEKIKNELDKNYALGELQDIKQLYTPTSPSMIGFMWSDFAPVSDFYYRNGRGWAFDQELTRNLLSWPHAAYPTIALNAVLRAHQHSDSMPKFWEKKGAYPIWNGKVYTLLSAIGYFGLGGPVPFPYDTFSILETGKQFDQWSLRHYWREVTKLSPVRTAGKWKLEKTQLNQGDFKEIAAQ